MGDSLRPSSYHGKLSHPKSSLCLALWFSMSVCTDVDVGTYFALTGSKAESGLDYELGELSSSDSAPLAV